MIPQIGATLIWHFAVALSLALGLALCAQPTLARVARILAGGVAAAVGSFVARMVLAPLSGILALIHGGGWQPYDPDRLVDHVVMGMILGLCVGLGESVLTSARIRPVLGRNEGREFPIGAGVARIGSAEGIEVPLFGSPDVAPVHAQIWRQDGRWHLADGGAPGGTRVNGQTVSRCLLMGGEMIEIGPFRMEFLLKGASRSVYAPMAYSPPAVVSVPALKPVRAISHRLIDSFGAVVDLPVGATSLGRDLAADVKLAHDGLVSRLHARIVVMGAGATVEDLGSRNGTAVNNRSIVAPTPLGDGDTLKVGATAMTYRVG